MTTYGPHMAANRCAADRVIGAVVLDSGRKPSAASGLTQLFRSEESLLE